MKFFFTMLLLGSLIFALPFEVSAEFRVKGCTKKTAVRFNEEHPYRFCFRSDAILVGIMPTSANLNIDNNGNPETFLSIEYHFNDQTIEENLKNFGIITKKKKIETKNGITGFIYTQKDIDPAAPLHYGAIFANGKTKDDEYVRIYSDKNLLKNKDFARMVKTFRFIGR